MKYDSKEISDGAIGVLGEGALSEDQARELFQQGEEAVVFALLKLTKRLSWLNRTPIYRPRYRRLLA